MPTPQVGQPFRWNFKMVDSTDFATPETGIAPVVNISKDGGTFSALAQTIVTGASAGGGWFSILVSSTDMTATAAIILRATGTGAAQADEAFYPTLFTVDDVRSAVSSVSGSLDTISGNVVTLSATLNTHSGTLDSISGGIQTLSGAIGVLSATLNTHSGTLDSISATVHYVSGAVNAASGTLDTMSGSIQYISGAVDTLSGGMNLDIISASVQYISGAVNLLSGLSGGILSGINSNVLDINIPAPITLDLSKLLKKGDKDEIISFIKERFDDAFNSISDIIKKLDTLKLQISSKATAENIESHSQLLSEMETKLLEKLGELGFVLKDKGTLKEIVSSINEEVVKYSKENSQKLSNFAEKVSQYQVESNDKFEKLERESALALAEQEKRNKIREKFCELMESAILNKNIKIDEEEEKPKKVSSKVYDPAVE